MSDSAFKINDSKLLKLIKNFIVQLFKLNLLTFLNKNSDQKFETEKMIIEIRVCLYVSICLNIHILNKSTKNLIK